jgi:hypothetical protein
MESELTVALIDCCMMQLDTVVAAAMLHLMGVLLNG